MDDEIPLTARRVSHRRAPDEVWDRVREDFLSGVPAAECCRRHGVGLSTLKRRSAAGGWRRADQPWPEPLGYLPPDDEGLALDQAVEGDLDRVALPDLTWVALRRMMRAVLKGDSVAALRWRRVRQVLDDEETELQRKLMLFRRDHPELAARRAAPIRRRHW